MPTGTSGDCEWVCVIGTQWVCVAPGACTCPEEEECKPPTRSGFSGEHEWTPCAAISGGGGPGGGDG